MEYIIGGQTQNPDLVINNAIDFFQKRFSKVFEFEGITDQGYFMGIVREKANKNNRNIIYFDGDKIFKSLYYHDIPNMIKSGNSGADYDDVLRNIHNDFILTIYNKNNGISVFKDIFAREKVYYTLKPPFLFSTSLKFLISNLDDLNINSNALLRYLGNGLNIGEETVISNIKRLDIGEYLRIHNNNFNVGMDWNIDKDFFITSKHDLKNIIYIINPI
jgi:hypothetical protein